MAITNPSFIILDSVDSTNNYAMANVHAGLAKQGDAYFALQQTGGKGQRGKNWHTGNGKNIALSIIAEPAGLTVAEQFKLSASVALACFDFFSTYAGDETSIKWPNDIYWRDRKAGGVLIENIIGPAILQKSNAEKLNEVTGNQWKYAVLGIGININETVFDTSLKNVVSLKQITGKKFDVIALAKELHKKVLKRIGEINTLPFEKILQQYNAHLFKINSIARLKKGKVIFDTMIKGVTEKGQLYTVDTIDNFFDFGEVEWVI